VSGALQNSPAATTGGSTALNTRLSPGSANSRIFQTAQIIPELLLVQNNQQIIPKVSYGVDPNNPNFQIFALGPTINAGGSPLAFQTDFTFLLGGSVQSAFTMLWGYPGTLEMFPPGFNVSFASTNSAANYIDPVSQSLNSTIITSGWTPANGQCLRWSALCDSVQVGTKILLNGLSNTTTSSTGTIVQGLLQQPWS